MTARGVAMPEWLTRRDIDNGAWNVTDGPAQRGKAWTRLHDRTMRVPIGGDETNRVIRAHEMCHARVSPVACPILPDVTADSLEAAEEYRVNTLIKAAGFDLTHLVDGSERKTGERLAEIKDYAQLVRATAALGGGKACADFLRGVAKVDKDLAKSLRELEKSLGRLWNDDGGRRNPKAAAAKWGETTPTRGHGSLEGEPYGFVSKTVPIARALDALINALETGGDDDGDDDGEQEPMDPKLVRSLVGDRQVPWADTVRFGDIPLTRRVHGAVGRKRVAANTGTNPRRMNRMLTDPHRRVFDRKRRLPGGVVVIDMSGSMSLSSTELETMMTASPGCLIVGYSHLSTGEPNAWVLARNGRRVARVPNWGAGNGIDGPIIEWAVKQARRNEPIVWVCDGIVTGKGDAQGTNLEIEAATLVRKHNIHMVRTVERGVKAMKDLNRGRRLPTTFTGPVLTAATSLGWVKGRAA